MSPTNKRKRTSNVSAAESIEDPTPRMVLRPRKVRVLSPPASNIKSTTSKSTEALLDEEPTAPENESVAHTNTSLKKSSKVVDSLPQEEEAEPLNGKPDFDGAVAPDQESSDNDHDSDSDAAPETVSLATSQAQSLKHSAKQARALKEQEELAKQKRRERDARLKVQADERTRKKEKESAKKREVLGALEIQSLENEAGDTTKGGVTTAEDGDLLEHSTAEFLPQYILDALPTHRSPTPPPKSKHSYSTLTKSEILVKKHTKHGITRLPLPPKPKDLSINSHTTISVLDNTSMNTTLAPKTTIQGRVSRDNWLLGRPTLTRLDQPKASALADRGSKPKSRKVKPNFRMERKAWGARAKFA